MAKIECITCGGVYEAAQRDGTDYYHVCPPLRLRRVKDAGGVERVASVAELTDVCVLSREEFAARQRRGEDVSKCVALIDEWDTDRAERRDETPTGPPPAPGARRPIRSEGRGARAVTTSR